MPLNSPKNQARRYFSHAGNISTSAVHKCPDILSRTKLRFLCLPGVSLCFYFYFFKLHLIRCFLKRYDVIFHGKSVWFKRNKKKIMWEVLFKENNQVAYLCVCVCIERFTCSPLKTFLWASCLVRMYRLAHFWCVSHPCGLAVCVCVGPLGFGWEPLGRSICFTKVLSSSMLLFWAWERESERASEH